MRVIVTIEQHDLGDWNIRVRKCPPHEVMFGYKGKSNEFICELEDYSDEDIRKYMEKEIPLTYQEAQTGLSQMANYLLTGKKQ